MPSELEKLAIVVDHAARVSRMTGVPVMQILAARADALREDLEDWIEDRLDEVAKKVAKSEAATKG